MKRFAFPDSITIKHGAEIFVALDSWYIKIERPRPDPSRYIIPSDDVDYFRVTPDGMMAVDIDRPVPRINRRTKTYQFDTMSEEERRDPFARDSTTESAHLGTNYVIFDASLRYFAFPGILIQRKPPEAMRVITSISDNAAHTSHFAIGYFVGGERVLDTLAIENIVHVADRRETKVLSVNLPKVEQAHISDDGQTVLAFDGNAVFVFDNPHV